MKKIVTDGLAVENLKSEDYKFLIEAKIELAENQAENLISRDITYNLNEMESFLNDIELELVLGANQQTDIVNSYSYFIRQQLLSNSAGPDSMLQDYSESQRLLMLQENLMMENYLSLNKSIIAKGVDIMISDVTDNLTRYTSVSKATIESFGHASPGFFEDIGNIIYNSIQMLTDPNQTLLQVIAIGIQAGIKLITNAVLRGVDINEANVLEKIQEGFNFIQNIEQTTAAAPESEQAKAEEEYAKSEYELTET